MEYLVPVITLINYVIFVLLSIQLTSEDDLSFDSDSDAMDVSQDVKGV